MRCARSVAALRRLCSIKELQLCDGTQLGEGHSSYREGIYSAAPPGNQYFEMGGVSLDGHVSFN